jgi:hypothetical protein
MDLALGVVLGCASGAVLLAWLYFGRYQVTRPPIGVVNLWDVVIMVGAIVLVPYLYLLLPLWLVAALLGVGYLSVLYAAAEPVLRARWAIWLAALALLAADVGAARLFGPASFPFLAVNNVLLIVVVVGVANLWAQSGMQARDATVLAAALALYDALATAVLPLMTDLITRLAEIPFAPLVAWPIGDEGDWLGIGLGDLLLAAVFPLVMRRTFGRGAGVAALALGLAAIGGLLGLLALGVVQVTLPAMVALGPLMVVQYVYWSRRGEGIPTRRAGDQEFPTAGRAFTLA